MKFKRLFLRATNKFKNVPQNVINRNKLAVEINDIKGDAFYILWENGILKIEPYHYNDYNVKITASISQLNLLLTQKQYLFYAFEKNYISVDGSFADVMDFQKLLTYITDDKELTVHDDVVSEIILNQSNMQSDLGIIMESLKILMANDIVNNFVGEAEGL